MEFANSGGWFTRAKQMFTRLVGGEATHQPSQPQQHPSKTEPANVEDQKFVDVVFNKVSKMVRSSTKLNQEQQLVIYGLFKQATEGDNNRSKPAFYEIEASAKHAAWEKCKGLSKHQAKELYIKYANTYDQTIGQKLIEAIESPEVEVEPVRDEKGMLGSLSRPQTGDQPSYSHPYIAAMEKSEPIPNPDKTLLLTMNTQPQILPLHYAIDNELVDYVRQFVKVLDKSQINLADGEGMTTLQYAQLLENEQILQMIRTAL